MKYLRLIVFTMTMLVAQTVIAQEKRNYRDIAFDYLMQNISSIEARPWSVKADHYDKLSNGGYLVKLTISRTLTLQEEGLVNNQVQAYGATFNVGVRRGNIYSNYEDTKSYFVFIDRFGEPSKYMEASTDHEFHSWGGNAWLFMNKHNEKAGNKELRYYSNAACFNNEGETKWSGRDMKIYGWAFSGSTLYLVGTLWDNGRSIVRSIDIKTQEANDKVGNSGVIPSDIAFGEKGLTITQYASNGQSSDFIFPYSASDRQFQIDQVLKSYDLTRTSDQIALGERYLEGNVVDKDEKKAIELFEKAANQNNNIGMLKLADCYKKGVGVTQDNAKAFSLYEKSAKMGNIDAMIALSDMYAEGDGIEKNMSKALYWKEKLAFSGNSDAQIYILANQSVEYEKADITADEAYKKGYESIKEKSYNWAKYCLERAINLGSKDAMLVYAEWLYWGGGGITKDYDKAIDMLSKLGEENNKYAQKMLALIYRENKGVAPDVKKEMYWVAKSAENGDVDSQLRLAYGYQNGIGVKKNKKLAFVMYEKAAEQGSQEAIRELVYCYTTGKGVKKDESECIDWFKKLNLENQLSVTKDFEENPKIKVDIAVLIYMYEIAAEKKHYGAMKKYAELSVKYLPEKNAIDAVNLLEYADVDYSIKNADSYMLMGQLHEKYGRIGQAIECYKNSGTTIGKERASMLNRRREMPHYSNLPKGIYINNGKRVIIRTRTATR